MIGTSPVERTAAGEALEPEQELMTINMGPHHPATHGVLRLLVSLEGEVVRDLKPVVGYVHTGIEKNCEDKSYWKVIPFVERMDYLSYFFNMEAFVGCVERLLELEIPPRAKYLRVIHLELNRIHSHLVWLGTSALDLGAMSMFFYCFRDRDRILDLFEMSTGQRMHTRYFQVGGVFEDIPVGFERKVRAFCAEMPSRIDQYEAILNRNEIFLRRTKNVGVVPRQRLLDLGVTGPLLRAAGEPWDLRKVDPTPRLRRTSTSRSRSARSATATTATGSGCRRCASRCGSSSRPSTGFPRARGSPTTARWCCRRATSSRPRWRRLIHHFKLVTEGFRVPPGEAYYAVESPRGELGCFVVADGSAKPARVHFRDPSFVNLQALRDMCVDGYIADLIQNLAMLDPILGGIDR